MSARASFVRFDLPASIVVFLIAIPLSLGIAVASGAPISAGLIAAAIGGVVAGALGGSAIQVSGPAAGMVVLVAGFIGDYGWATVCAITAAAGALQILLGALNAGKMTRAIPPAVVHGMLAGIGITIALGQVMVMLGAKAESKPIANLLALPSGLASMNVMSAVVGLGTIAVLVVWPKLPSAIRRVPGPLVAIAGATVLASALNLDIARVELPDDITNLMFTPRFEDISVTQFVSAAVMMAALASVESLLSAVAVDKLHTGPRANLRRELFGQGVANMASGSFGGLPITGVIVRSSTNALAGARSRGSAIMHGVWVVLFVVFLGSVLESVPMAALAGLLVYTGVKLVNVAHMRELALHKDLWLYVLTIAGVLVVGLVEGVLLGIVGSLLLLPRRSNVHHLEATREGDTCVLQMKGTIGFMAVPSLLASLGEVPTGATVRLNMDLHFLDHAALSVLMDWMDAHRATGGTVLIDEMGEPWLTSAHNGNPLVARSKAGLPQSRSPRWFESRPADGSGSLTLAGIEDFHAHHDEFKAALAPLAQGQQPRTLLITCCDSRVVPHMITASGPGDLFIVRTIGNLIPEWSGGQLPETGSSVAAAIDYAIGVLGVEEIVVCGHSSCGAIGAVVGGVPDGEFAALRHWMQAVPAAVTDRVGEVEAGTLTVDELARHNVSVQVQNLRSHPEVARRVAAGELRTLGIFFDIADVRAHVLAPVEGAGAVVVEPVPVETVPAETVLAETVPVGTVLAGSAVVEPKTSRGAEIVVKPLPSEPETVTLDVDSVPHQVVVPVARS